MLPTSYGVHFHCPSLVELLISSEIAQRRRNKREEPGSKGPELSASWIIGTWEMVGLTGTKWENRWDVSILFQTLISGPGFILPHRPASAKGEKKHINFVETFYLMSLRSHVALIFFFLYYLSLSCLRFSLGGRHLESLLLSFSQDLCSDSWCISHSSKGGQVKWLYRQNPNLNWWLL